MLEAILFGEFVAGKISEWNLWHRIRRFASRRPHPALANTGGASNPDVQLAVDSDINEILLPANAPEFYFLVEINRIKEPRLTA